jgi:hypothetical protein
MNKLAIEITGSFLGQEIPSWLRVFDCRKPIGEEIVKAPWTNTYDGKTYSPSLFGSECAAVDLGLRGKGVHEDTTPVSGSGYGDTRRSESEALSAVRSMIEAAQRTHQDWEEACGKPMSTNGGSVCYQPIAVALCNFGWSVICDRRGYRVVSFS